MAKSKRLDKKLLWEYETSANEFFSIELPEESSPSKSISEKPHRDRAPSRSPRTDAHPCPEIGAETVQYLTEKLNEISQTLGYGNVFLVPGVDDYPDECGLDSQEHQNQRVTLVRKSRRDLFESENSPTRSKKRKTSESPQSIDCHNDLLGEEYLSKSKRASRLPISPAKNV